MKRIILALSGLVTVASAQSMILIDDFNSGTLFVDSKVDFYSTGAHSSGIRYGATSFFSNPQNRNSVIEVANDKMYVENDTGVAGQVVYATLGGLLNGAPASGNGGLSTNDAGSYNTAVNLTGESHFEIVFSSSDQSNASFAVFVYEKSGANVGTINFSSIYAVPQGGGTVLVPFTDVFSTVPVSNIGSIGMVFDLPSGNDLSINNFAAVPEPASMIALGAGIVALIRRRRVN
ncbi:MAG: PEP-CTERM sorting domain-containing protein [Fimbriimonadaceae bacterium]|nr:PEP-CTERM sorting domain-containing protein [Fimbriimonadaceae bacterium]